MLYALAALLLLMTVTAVVLYFNVRMHKEDADHIRNLLWEARAQLGGVRDALADLPQDAGTLPATIIFRHKAEALKTRNKVWEAQKVLQEAEATTPEAVRLVKQLDKILA